MHFSCCTQSMNFDFCNFKVNILYYDMMKKDSNFSKIPNFGKERLARYELFIQECFGLFVVL